MSSFDRDSMLEMFIYEMNHLLEQLEQIVIQGEDGYETEQINEIFRIMHTIKGSAAMMMFNNISTTAHKMEDLFFYIREESPTNVDYKRLTDLVLEGMDFIKIQLSKVEEGQNDDGDASETQAELLKFLEELKGISTNSKVSVATIEAPTKTQNATYNYEAKVFFDEGSEMENIRAYNLIHKLQDKIFNVMTTPEDLFDESIVPEIKQNGIILNFDSTFDYEEVHDFLSDTIFLKSLELKNSKGSEESGSNGKSEFVAHIRYDEGCEMENVRAFSLVHNLNDIFKIVKYTPSNLLEEKCIDDIKKDGFTLEFNSDKSYDEIYNILNQTIYLKELKLEEKVENSVVSSKPDANLANTEKSTEKSVEKATNIKENKEQKETNKEEAKKSQPPSQKVISVNIGKLDQLLNLMGELVIAEAMVTQNPDLDSLPLENFFKETRHLRKIITDVQDTVMSMRMVALSATFFKMHRIVRDMCRSLNKDVKLEIIGEETEVDKNIIEHISDPLMHIIRNSIDHGIEMPEDREKKGKNKQGTVTLEAKNSGGDVLIIVRDDGQGLNRDKIMAKAKKNGLLTKPESDYTDKEVYQFIFLPGFSTNEVVTGYSGRGVGMDVVTTNIESVGGTILVDSVFGQNSVFTLKIPLTLAIIEGMTIKIGEAKYTIPIISIKQSFKPFKKDIFRDPNGNEMITVRGECYNVVRLDEFFSIQSSINDVEEGIMIMLENGDQTVCLLADELIGEQQVVVKTIPKYIKKSKGISGCTLLGNGDISLIIDVSGFFDK